MAQLARIEFTIQDAAGNAVSGASVQVMKQGAQVNGAQSGSPLTVDDVGALVTGDSLQVNTTGSPTRTATISSATSVSCGAGFTVSDDDRLICVTPLPTIYNDAIGNETKTNPLTTDANGYAYCYVVGGKYDILVSGSITTRLIQDMSAVGGENNRCNIYNSGSAVAWVDDTLRTLGAGDKIRSFRNAGVEKSNVAYDGSFTGPVAATTLSASGATTTNGITNTGAISTTTDTTMRRVLARNGTSLVNGDFALIATAWGDTASVAVTANSYDTRGRFTVTSAGVGQSAGAGVTMAFKDGAFPQTPRCICVRGESSNPSTGYWLPSPGTTGVTFAFTGLPVAGQQYICDYVVIG